MTNEQILVVLICCEFLPFYQQIGFKKWGALIREGAFIANNAVCSLESTTVTMKFTYWNAKQAFMGEFSFESIISSPGTFKESCSTAL